MHEYDSYDHSYHMFKREKPQLAVFHDGTQPIMLNTSKSQAAGEPLVQTQQQHYIAANHQE
jgi:hypothetical protein